MDDLDFNPRTFKHRFVVARQAWIVVDDQDAIGFFFQLFLQSIDCVNQLKNVDRAT